ncbi:MAG: hypothetical protein ACK44Q_20830, partial [Pirellulaceae bacterium]
ETRRVCEPGRSAVRCGRVGTRGDGVGWWRGKTCPASTPGVGIGVGLWFWCVPRRGDLREVLNVFWPRHTPYEEARHSAWHGRPARACAGETRRVCEPGRSAVRCGRVGTRGDGVGG